MSETKKPFLNNIHLFRAFAIICVVAVHTWHIPSKYKQGHEGAYLLVEQIREVFFHDSTTYFVFISGFLFFYLSSNFNVNKYYQSKLKRVLVPYILLTTLLAVSGRVDVAGDHFFDLASVYLGGTAQTQFWYIPFIAVVFLVSPLLLNINFSGVGIVLIALIPLLGTRTGTEITFWQFAYFSPVDSISKRTT
jgi:surface polysaccharide O-acyltransferase-like enzyme